MRLEEMEKKKSGADSVMNSMTRSARVLVFRAGEDESANCLRT